MGRVKVGNSQIKRAGQKFALGVYCRGVATVVPQSQGHGMHLKSSVAASAVGNGVAATSNVGLIVHKQVEQEKMRFRTAAAERWAAPGQNVQV